MNYSQFTISIKSRRRNTHSHSSCTLSLISGWKWFVVYVTLPNWTDRVDVKHLLSTFFFVRCLDCVHELRRHILCRPANTHFLFLNVAATAFTHMFLCSGFTNAKFHGKTKFVSKIVSVKMTLERLSTDWIRCKCIFLRFHFYIAFFLFIREVVFRLPCTSIGGVWVPLCVSVCAFACVCTTKILCQFWPYVISILFAFDRRSSQLEISTWNRRSVKCSKRFKFQANSK